MATKTIRNKTIMTRFTEEEFICIEELRKRVNCTTNGKLFRNIILTVALHPGFDFLAEDSELKDLPKIENRLLLFEKINVLVSMLEEENIITTNNQ